MNHLLTSQKSDQVDRPASLDRKPFSIPKATEIVKMICADARKDALKYALRSDTGQDGE